MAAAAGGAAPRCICVSFNQDAGCLACGTDAGFRIFNTQAFGETFRRDAAGGVGGIAICEMLYRTNLLALVGGGSAPKYPPNKVMIWDDHQGRCIGELAFRSEVRAVRLRRERIAVALEHKVYVYNFADLKLLHQTETLANTSGLLALSHAPGAAVLACPGLHRGALRLEWYDAPGAAGGGAAGAAATRRTRFVSAHDGALAALALCADGSRVATASDKGTLVRVFDTATGAPLAELRRGADRACIFSIAFSPAPATPPGAPPAWVAASSDKGTVHVWPLPAAGAAGEGGAAQPQPEAPGGGGNGGSGVGGSGAASFVKGLLPRYFSSAWSHAQFRLPAGSGGAAAATGVPGCAGASAATAPCSVVAFGAEPHTLLVAVANGTFHKCTFDPVAGGEVAGGEFVRFLQPEGEAEAAEAGAGEAGDGGTLLVAGSA